MSEEFIKQTLKEERKEHNTFLKAEKIKDKELAKLRKKNKPVKRIGYGIIN